MGRIGPGLANFLHMNNYFHDVATALLAASGIVLCIILRRFCREEGRGTDPEMIAYFSRVYVGMRRLAHFSLVWILLGGIPRTLYFRSFEWTNAMEHGQVPALILKHAMSFILVALGALLWIRCSRKIKAIIGDGTEN